MHKQVFVKVKVGDNQHYSGAFGAKVIDSTDTLNMK